MLLPPYPMHPSAPSLQGIIKRFRNYQKVPEESSKGYLKHPATQNNNSCNSGSYALGRNEIMGFHNCGDKGFGGYDGRRAVGQFRAQ